VQAFSTGNLAYALQFHMDVTHATMCRWTTRGHERMSLPNAKPREAHFADRLLHDPACRAWLSEFIDQWLKPCEAPKPAIGSHKPPQRRASKLSTL
jgi:GMP synthase (glutamine-hydrolysing)